MKRIRTHASDVRTRDERETLVSPPPSGEKNKTQGACIE